MTAGKAARDRTTGLTHKQEAFCRAVIQGAKISDAYKQAYDAESMSDVTIGRRAIELMRDSRITARLDALRAPQVAAVIAAGAITMEGHLAKLAELRDESVRLGQMGAAITAEVSRGKVGGYYIERREQGQAGEFQALEALRKKEAIEVIEAEMRRRALVASGADQVDDVIPKS